MRSPSLTPGIRASDPIRFAAGGSRAGGGENPAADPRIRQQLAEGDPDALVALLEHIESQYAMLHELMQKLRMQRRRVWVERFYETNDKIAYAQETTDQDVRITYVFGYVGGGKQGNFNLRGGQSNTSFSLPIPANTQPPLIVPLGDGDTGGLVLRPQDIRSITTTDGSQTQLIGLLCGEQLGDTFLS